MGILYIHGWYVVCICVHIYTLYRRKSMCVCICSIRRTSARTVTARTSELFLVAFSRDVERRKIWCRNSNPRPISKRESFACRFVDRADISPYCTHATHYAYYLYLHASKRKKKWKESSAKSGTDCVLVDRY